MMDTNIFIHRKKKTGDGPSGSRMSLFKRLSKVGLFLKQLHRSNIQVSDFHFVSHYSFLPPFLSAVVEASTLAVQQACKRPPLEIWPAAGGRYLTWLCIILHMSIEINIWFNNRTNNSPHPFPGLRPVNRLRSQSSIIQVIHQVESWWTENLIVFLVSQLKLENLW